MEGLGAAEAEYGKHLNYLVAGCYPEDVEFKPGRGQCGSRPRELLTSRFLKDEDFGLNLKSGVEVSLLTWTASWFHSRGGPDS